MNKIRFLAAMLVAKCVRLLLRMLGRNGSFLPGDIALRIDPDFLGNITKPETFIAVTGTNGKTTTSNLINSIFEKNGIKVMNNSLGSNVQSGVAGCFVEHCTLTGKPKEKVAVLEVDERSSLRVYKYIAPDYLICNNIMRDSIKRNANTDFISYILNTAVPPTTKVFLNGDDCICSHLAPANRNRFYFGLDAEKPEVSVTPHLVDITYCPECDTLLSWEYRRYNHIGRCRCPKCGWGTPERDYVVTDFNTTDNTFTVEHKGESHTYNLINDNIVNVYNSCGAIALLTEFGMTPQQIEKGFGRSEVVKTRLDTVTVGNTELVFLLAKGQNPCAVARCFSYVASAPGEKKAVISIVDDHDDNIRNSENTAWLFDLDYKPLLSDSISVLLFGGERYYDHVLRCAMTGIADEKVMGSVDYTEIVSMIKPADYDRIFILFDNYRLAENEKVKSQLIAALKGGN